MDKKNIAKAFILLAVLGVCLAYYSYLQGRPETYSLLYFEPQSLKSGFPIATIENHEGAETEYSVRVSVGSFVVSRKKISIPDGKSLSFSPLENSAFEWNSTLFVSIRPGSKPELTIYATPT